MTPAEIFKKNIAEVDNLINFDRQLLDLVTLTVEGLHDQLKSKFGDERLNGARALAVIRGIRSNETLRLKYQAIYNQAVVLLVSHFASALGDLFRQAVSDRLASAEGGKLLEEELKLTVADLKDRNWDLTGAIPDLLIAKHDFTFQDMGATVRAFSTYAGITPERNVVMNNIIAAQACRHVIVHAGGRVGDKTTRQLSKVIPRTFRQELRGGEQIAFTLEEIHSIKTDMVKFIETLAES